jgi:RHS repeat-associated protein
MFPYSFTVSDHLGNIRVVVDEQGQVQQKNEYTAFGVVQSTDPSKNKYLFNNKELQTGTNYLDYGARMYQPELGRWNVVDPLGEESRKWSLYNFSFNNPLRFVDPDGRAPYDWIKLQNGSITYDANVNNQSQATIKYGVDSYIGKTAMLMNASGQQLNLNANGTATSSTMLNEVTVTGKTGSSLTGTLDNLSDAVDLSNNLNTGVIAGASKLGNALGAAAPVIKVLDDVAYGLGVTGAVISTVQAFENPTAGNILKARS